MPEDICKRTHIPAGVLTFRLELDSLDEKVATFRFGGVVNVTGYAQLSIDRSHWESLGKPGFVILPVLKEYAS